MAYWPLALELVFTLCCVAFVYNIYASWRKQPWYVTVSVIFGWWISFGVVFLVTVDLTGNYYDYCVRCWTKENTTLPSSSSSSEESDFFFSSSTSSTSSSSSSSGSSSDVCRTRHLHAECVKPLSYISSKELITLWTIVYWTTQVLCWLVYPLLQSYYASAEFHFYKRVWRAVKENLIFYAIAGVISLIFVIYFLITKSMDKEKILGTAILTANTFGIVTLILLLGWGLVEVPRQLWRKANRPLAVKHHLYRIAGFQHELDEATLELNKVLREVRQASEDVPSNDPYRKYIELIINEAPLEYQRVFYAEGEVEITYGSLVSLRGRVLNALAGVHRAQALLDEEISTTIDLEDIVSSVGRGSRINYSRRPPRGGFLAHIDRMEYIWRTYLETIALRAGCLFCAFLSVLTVWSEGTFFISKPVLSVFAKLTQIPDMSNSLLQAVILIPLGYIMICCYYSMLRFRMFNIYRLIPHQATDPYSMLFSGLLISRQIAPMAYNYMLLLHRGLEDASVAPAFMHVMAAMQSVYSSFASFLNNGIPVLLLAFCLITLFNLGDRIMACFKVKRFKFSDDWSDQQIDEGRDILERARSAREAGLTRQRNIQRLETMDPDRTARIAAIRSARGVSSPAADDLPHTRQPSSSAPSLSAPSLSSPSLSSPISPPPLSSPALSSPPISSPSSPSFSSPLSNLPSSGSSSRLMDEEEELKKKEEDVVQEPQRRGFWSIFSRIKSPGGSRSLNDDEELLERTRSLMNERQRGGADI